MQDIKRPLSCCIFKSCENTSHGITKKIQIFKKKEIIRFISGIE